MKTRFCSFVFILSCSVLFLTTFDGRLNAARPKAGPDITIKSDTIGGVVTSSKGPEAGVWVIAETTDLPTKLVKIVVTDDAGRYLLPQLPKANYKVWVRGYGLVDSQPVMSEPGKMVNLTAVLAADARAAAQYYPAEYWQAMLKIPPASDFPGTGAAGNGIPEKIKSQGEWIDMVKVNGCTTCHQIGDKATREVPAVLGHFNSGVEAWRRRLASAQNGPRMTAQVALFGTKRGLEMYGDWTDRVAAGELPAEAPPRPQGIERNVVITEWDWSTHGEYMHDQIATDRRHPTVNANGLVYGVHEISDDKVSVLDPVHNSVSYLDLPIRDADTPYAQALEELFPSPYFGDEMVFKSKTEGHSLAMDQKGRVWFVARFRGNDNPAFCKEGSDNPSAKLFPLDKGNRQVEMFDPETKKISMIDLCYSAQHVMFSEDKDDTLWFSNPGGNTAVGWLKTKVWDQTHDASKSQGWTSFILDTNGNGKRDNDNYTQLGQPEDPTKDMRVRAGDYGINPSPADGSIWGTVLEFPGYWTRLSLGSNPPATTIAEIYQMPWEQPKAAVQGFGPRVGDIDRNGVVWAALTSGHMSSFDRRKCKGPLNGPKATGQQCPEGWTLYSLPGPKFKGVDYVPSADSVYYTWVDQFDELGLGKNIPLGTGDGSESLVALVPETKKVYNFRIPYPMGYYSKSIDGRIDDPRGGWKGKEIWTTFATRAPQHIEPTGPDVPSKILKIQLRPDPLAD